MERKFIRHITVFTEIQEKGGRHFFDRGNNITLHKRHRDIVVSCQTGEVQH